MRTELPDRDRLGGYDCIVGYVHHSERDPVKFVRDIRAKQADLPVIVVVQTFDQTQAERVYEAGADGYLERRDGVDQSPQLAHRIEQCIERYWAQHDPDESEYKSRNERYRHAVETLHESTRELMEAESPEDAAETLVETVEDVLGLPLSAVFLRSDDGTRLEPAASSPAVDVALDDQPVFHSGDQSIAQDVFESGEIAVIEEVQTSSRRYTPGGTIESELVVPLGEYGVCLAGSTDRASFDEEVVALAEILGANTESALERVHREWELSERNEKVEFFNSLLRHDVLNGVQVIQARAELLDDRVANEDIAEHTTTILRWVEEVSSIINRVRSILGLVKEDSTHEQGPVDLGEIVEREFERARSAHPSVEFETDIPPDTTVVADELLNEVVANVVTNAVQHNDPKGLTVSATVDNTGETYCLRLADTGDGIVDERKESVFDRGETRRTNTSRGGLGLYFVETMVDAYGGDTWVEDLTPEEGDRGGAVFCLELQKA